MDFMPSNKWAVDLVQSSDVCVHHCGGIITAASNALDFVMSQLIWFGLAFLQQDLAVLRYLESPAEKLLQNRKWRHLAGDLPHITQYSTIYKVYGRRGRNCSSFVSQLQSLTPKCSDSCEALADVQQEILGPINTGLQYYSLRAVFALMGFRLKHVNRNCKKKSVTVNSMS